MFRFLHTADIHLDSPLKGLEGYLDAPLAELQGATRRALENLVQLACDEAVDFVLVSGDLYDGDWKDYNTGLFFVACMGRLERANIPVYMVSGNHDAESRISRRLPLPANVQLFPAGAPASQKIDRLRVAIHGQSYPARAVTDNLAARYPDRCPDHFNIGLLHTALNGRPGHEPYAPCSLDDLHARGYDYWALGHVHTHEIVSRDPWVVYPGNLQGRHIREAGAKGATLVRVEEGRVVEVEQRQLDVLRWQPCSVDCNGCEAPEAVHDRVRSAMAGLRAGAEGRPLALRLALGGATVLHSDLVDRLDRWTEEFRGLAVGLGDIWLEKVQLDTRHPLDLNELIGRDTALAELVEAISGLDLDAEALTGAAPELVALKARLPRELLEGDEPLFAATPARLGNLRAQVRELLLARLLRHGGNQ